MMLPNLLDPVGPNLDRWCPTDPLGFAANDSNTQRYVGNSPIWFTDPDGLAKFNPLTAANASDVKIASEIEAIEKEMLTSNWTPKNPKDSGAYGAEVSKRLNERIAENGGSSCGGTFRTGVLVHKRTGSIIAFDKSKGTADAFEVDVMFFPKGRTPTPGMIIDPNLDIAYEVKTSAGGTMEATQEAKYAGIFGNKFRKVTSKYRLDQVPGAVKRQIVENADFNNRLKTLAVAGLGLTVYSMLTTDAQGAEYDRLCYAIDRAKRTGGFPDELDQNRLALVTAFKEYLDAVSGGYTKDATGALQYFMTQKIMSNYDSGK